VTQLSEKNGNNTKWNELPNEMDWTKGFSRELEDFFLEHDETFINKAPYITYTYLLNYYFI